MKIYQIIPLASILCTLPLFTSCDNDSGEETETTTESYTYSFESPLEFTSQGYWAEVYNTTLRSITVQPNLIFSHYAETQTYNGVDYKVWNGFCPSRAIDGADHSSDNWVDYQWSCAMKTANATAAGANGSMDYLLACWDVAESTTSIPDEPVCAFAFVGKTKPVSMMINNSNWGYWAMKNGTFANEPFTDKDWTRVIIHGLRNGVEVSNMEVYLARNGYILNEWMPVDLSGLGQVDVMYFQMESSATGQWGMNIPAYFCIDDLEVAITVPKL